MKEEIKKKESSRIDQNMDGLEIGKESDKK